MSDQQPRALRDTTVKGRERSLTLFGLEGEYIFERIRSSGAFYEFTLLQALARLPVRPNALIFDVGANIGNHAVYFAEFMDREVVAVEPQPENADLLEANLGINGLRDRVRVVRGALWDSTESLSLEQQIPGNFGSFRAIPDKTGELQGTTLDSLVGEGGKVGLIKIDTEGTEGLVLAGARRTIQREHPFLCVEAHGPTAFQSIAEMLEPLGYEMIDVGGYSANLVWAHPSSLAYGTIDSLRLRSLRIATRQLEQQVDRRIDGISRRLVSLNDLVERSHNLEGGLPEQLKLELAEVVRAEMSEAVTALGPDPGEIRDLLAQSSDSIKSSLSQEMSALRDLVDEQSRTRAELENLRRIIGRLQAENDLWRESYASIAASRSVRIGAALLGLLGKRRTLLDPEARARWVTRHAQRVEGARVNRPLQIRRAAASAPSTPRDRHESSAADIIRAGLATVPERIDGLKQVVDRLHGQVDELYIYLNRFSETPDFLTGDSKIRVVTGEDLGDRAKFYSVDGFNGYFFSVDDDIDYPRFYVEHLIDGIERYGRRAVVGWHGSIIKKGFRDYYEDASRRVFSFRSHRPQDTPVHILGTGCAAFHTSALRLSLKDFPAPNMADIYFALQGQKQRVPFIVLAHEAHWARDLDISGAKSISQVSMAQTVDPVFNVRKETNRIVRSYKSWTTTKVEPLIVRDRFRLAIVGRTDRERWKKGGILKSTHLTADMLRPLGVDARLFDLATGDPRELGGFDPHVVMIYPGDPQRPDFAECESLVEHHADRGTAVLINLSVIMRDWREDFIVDRLVSWRETYGKRISALVFAEQVRDFPRFAEVREMIVAIPKTIELPRSATASFHTTEGIFLGDIAKLLDDEIIAHAPAERWLEAIRDAVPEAPLYAVRQYRPKTERDLGIQVLPFLKEEYSRVLSRMRLMVSPVRHLTFEMVPVEVAALGIPVIYQKMEHSLSAYLGMSGVQVESPDELHDVLPDLYRDPTLWRAQSRSGQLRAASVEYRVMAAQMYIRLKTLTKYATS